MRFILGSLLAIYLLIVGAWAPAAKPVELVATGAFTVLAQPAVLLLAALTALVVAAVRRTAHHVPVHH